MREHNISARRGLNDRPPRVRIRTGDQVITYTDAASFALMKANDCTTVLGFDRDFEAAGFTLWTAAR